GELLLSLDVVDAHPDDGRPDLLEREDVVAEFAGLGRAAGGIRLRIEVQRHPLATVLVECAPFPVLVLEPESGGGISDRGPCGTDRRKVASRDEHGHCDRGNDSYFAPHALVLRWQVCADTTTAVTTRFLVTRHRQRLSLRRLAPIT